MTANFKQIQHELASWLRSEEGAKNAIPDVEPRRLAIYRRLVRNNIQQFLTAGFPVLHAVLSPTQWSSLSAEFIHRHHAQSPLFSEIGAEFVDYLATFDTTQLKAKQLPEWLFELAHYERLEVEVMHADMDSSLHEIAELDDTTELYLNSTAVVAIYSYPVATISKANQPTTPLDEPYCMLVYREPEQEQVRFMQINTLTALVLEELKHRPLTFSQLLTRVQVQLPNQGSEALAHGLLSMLQDFCARFVLFTKS